MKRPPADSDEFIEALVELQQAKVTQKKALKSSGEVRSRYERIKGMFDRAQGRQAEAQRDVREAQRSAQESQRRAEDSRRKGMASHRWEADARRWTAEAQRLADGVRRWGEEARRKERDVRSSFLKVKEATTEVGSLQKAAFKLEQKLKFIALSEARGRSLQPSAREGDEMPLAVTEEAAASLRQVLDKTAHKPGQLLRLNADPEGNIRFTFDTAGEDDTIVTHQGSAVMIVESPLPESLQGATLDVDQTASGPSLILSR